MTKVQKKSCTCKSFDELEILKQGIHDIVQYFWLPISPKDDTCDLLHTLKEHIKFQERQIKGFVEFNELYRKTAETSKKCNSSPGEGKTIHMKVN